MKRDDNILEEKIKLDMDKERYEFPEEPQKKIKFADVLMALIAIIIIFGLVVSLLKVL